MVGLNDFRVLNHIFGVSMSGKASKAKIGSNLVTFGQNLGSQKIVLGNPHEFLPILRGLHLGVI